MYDFNKQVESESRSSIPTRGIYKENVKFVRMTPKNPGEDIIFKILPAFDPARTSTGPDGNLMVDPLSHVPFRDAAGNLTQWGRYIYVSSFTGHGKEGKGGNRREIVSLKSFSDDPNVYDPLSIFLENISSDPIWKYLIEDKLDPDSPKEKPVVLERKAINAKLAAKLLCNIVDLRKKQEGVFLAEFSSSAFDSLFAEGGLAMAQNLNATEEDIARNPMIRWYVGDLTNMAENGPCFRVLKDPTSDRGRYAGYVVQIAFNSAKKPYRIGIEPEYLPYRYNLLDLSTVIKKPTEEELVNTLVSIFNQWNPTRQYHEYELLKQAFGHNFRIPDAPARGVGVGFGQPPAQDFGQAPVHGFGQPPQGFPGGQTAAPTQGFPGANAIPPSTGVPGLPPRTTQFSAAPNMDMGDIPMGNMQPPMTKMGAQQAQFGGAPMQPQQPQQPQQQPAQGYAQPAPQGVPMPGDVLPKFDRNEFLEGIKNRKK